MAEPGSLRPLQFNQGDLNVVPASERFWEKVGKEIKLEVADRHGQRWLTVETIKVIVATPDQTYEEIGNEINRSPGAIRYRRQAMIALLRDEHGAHERVQAYIADPKTHHKFADYAQVHEALEGLGYYSLPVSEQFELAVPLAQPRAGWRGDGTSAALARQKQKRNEVFDLLDRLSCGTAST